MRKQMSPIAAEYVQAVNSHDAAAFHALFADDAIVNDAGREFRGLAAIKTWSNREIFDAQVTLEVLDVAEHGSQTIITTKVDGNFDRTGLPDPVIVSHDIESRAGKIVSLTCRLASAPSDA